jgi:acetoin utilization protein AcuB
MTALELISDSIIPLKPFDKAEFALALMDEYKVLHLPIVSDRELIGLISESDILSQNMSESSVTDHKLTLSNVYVTENQHLYEIITAISAHRVTLLPVLGVNHEYLGSITLAELTNHLAGMFAINNPGGVIILEVNDKDYVLSEIARIVESNDAKVLSLYIHTDPDSTKLEITLKLNRIDIEPVLQTFSRFNYTIKASFSENSDYDGLRDRYDSLLKYLNV